jgi:hypothetical protein
VAVPLAVISAFAFVRDEFLSAESQERFKLPQWLPDWHWQTWTLITVTLFLLGTLESAYRLVTSMRAAKSPKSRDLLGNALQEGTLLFKEKLADGYAYPEWKQRASAWANTTAELIAHCFGEADRQLFVHPDPGMAGWYEGSFDKAHNNARGNLNIRLKVLRTLIERPIA